MFLSQIILLFLFLCGSETSAYCTNDNLVPDEIRRNLKLPNGPEQQCIVDIKRFFSSSFQGPDTDYNFITVNYLEQIQTYSEIHCVYM